MPNDVPLVVRHGDIVIVSQMLDPNGVNPKNRPCVVMDDPKSPLEPGLHLVVAISTIVPEPLPVAYVLLPYHAQGHPKTGLNKRNAAICAWVEVIDQTRITGRLGVVPGRRLAEIATELDRISPRPDSDRSSVDAEPTD